jgi:hypothetical protein
MEGERSKTLSKLGWARLLETDWVQLSWQKESGTCYEFISTDVAYGSAAVCLRTLLLHENLLLSEIISVVQKISRFNFLVHIE